MNDYIITDLFMYTKLRVSVCENLKHASKIFKQEQKFQKPSKIIKGYFDNFKLTDAVLSDYLNKEITLTNGNTVIVSLRFKKLQIEEPFIEVLYRRFEWNSIADMQDAASEIVTYYVTTKIRYIKFFSSTFFDDQPLNVTVKKSKELYAKKLEINDDTPGLRSGEVKLTPVKSMGFYSVYLKEYSVYNEEAEENRVFSTAETEEDLQELMKGGTLFNIAVQGKWAGIIGYDKQTQFSLEGISVVEEFLTSEFRGKGYAKYAQKLMIDSIRMKPDNIGKVFFGTINHKNVPSLDTARKNKRIKLGCWYELQPLPR